MDRRSEAEPDVGFLAALLGDGRSLFKLSALVLMGAGAFVLFQAATGHFLPHDTEFLGMDAKQLCSYHGCRIVHFMMHDRVSFGGVLLAIGVMYLWLAQFPLAHGESWAWRILAISGGAGFLSFLAYLGYGYLDTWPGAATLALIPIYALALWRTRSLQVRNGQAPPINIRSVAGRGRVLLLGVTFGLIVAGATIMILGSTRVFVPQDLEFIQATRDEVGSINSRLVPLIAHDRAGFGGALVSCGLAMFLSVLYGRMSKSLWQALTVAGGIGFATAIGVHPAIGYLSVSHLAPAVGACLAFGLGLFWSYPRKLSEA